jgi:hypothetical protein
MFWLSKFFSFEFFENLKYLSRVNTAEALKFMGILTVVKQKWKQAKSYVVSRVYFVEAGRKDSDFSRNFLNCVFKYNSNDTVPLKLD